MLSLQRFLGRPSGLFSVGTLSTPKLQIFYSKIFLIIFRSKRLRFSSWSLLSWYGHCPRFTFMLLLTSQWFYRFNVLVRFFDFIRLLKQGFADWIITLIYLIMSTVAVLSKLILLIATFCSLRLPFCLYTYYTFSCLSKYWIWFEIENKTKRNTICIFVSMVFFGYCSKLIWKLNQIIKKYL